MQTANEELINVSSHGVADLDQDGDTDIIVASDMGQMVGWIQNLGEGVLGPPAQLFDTPLLPRDAQPVDVDSDGDLDVYYTDVQEFSGSRWSEQMASGVFGPEAQLYGDESISGERTKLADLDLDLDGDGDGDPDAIVQSNAELTGIEPRLYANGSLSPIGQSFCDSLAVNSTGTTGLMSAYWAERVQLDSIELRVSALPLNQFGLLVGARMTGNPIAVAGSNGLLWHRDTVSGVATSSLTTGVTVTLR